MTKVITNFRTSFFQPSCKSLSADQPRQKSSQNRFFYIHVHQSTSFVHLCSTGFKELSRELQQYKICQSHSLYNLVSLDSPQVTFIHLYTHPTQIRTHRSSTPPSGHAAHGTPGPARERQEEWREERRVAEATGAHEQHMLRQAQLGPGERKTR